jgi:putative PIN family toxin of toxin-antitoxin system
MRPRVVADSNVIVSALYFGGNPEAVLDLAGKCHVDLFVSPFILEEVAAVLNRPKFGWPLDRIADALSGIRATIVDPGVLNLNVLDDDPDNRILECVLAAQASFLVTGDRDPLALETFHGCRIVPPATFVAIVR